MTLYTAGYRRNGERMDAEAFILSLPENAVIVDIREYRYSPGMPGYSGKALSSNNLRLRPLFTYRWLPELGNVKVDGKRRLPPSYVDQDKGIALLESYLRLYHRVVIFCACEKPEECHRSHVAAELLRRIPDLEVIHL